LSLKRFDNEMQFHKAVKIAVLGVSPEVGRIRALESFYRSVKDDCY